MKKKDYFCKYNWRTLVKANLKQIDTMVDFYNEWEEAEICDDLLECSELGHKLLEDNYYESSDMLSDKVDELIKDNKMGEAIEQDYKFAEKHYEDYKGLRKDLEKFFKLISKNVGEWN